MGGGWGVRCKGWWGSVEQNAQERARSVNIEPAICNGHLPYPWRQCWRELDARGFAAVKENVQGRVRTECLYSQVGS